MGCNESKTSVATGNTISPSRKPAPVDEPKKVEESVVVTPEEKEKGPEGSAGVKEGTQDATVEKKGDAAKEDEKEKPENIDENVKEEKAAEEKEPEKENGAKEVAENAEVSTTKEAEQAPAAPTPMVAETVDPAMPKLSNPPEKKE